ncbi:MAG: peptidylprolyl isomerase [Halobacteriovoraceae bacterium]|nr:peptidylprolyl isomerase [Halobacteriovoraceae bacterium]
MKKLKTMGMLGVLALSTACNKQGGSASVTPKTEDDKTFYSMGVLMGGRLKAVDLKDNEINMIVQGLKDAAKGKENKEIDIATYRGKVQSIFRARMQKNTDKVKKDGQAFVEKFVKSEGGTKTESGIAYKILNPGTGAKPKATDTVEVHYHGTLIDGKVFDSSVERKKKISFPLNRVIKCWTEGMQLVGVGGKIKLVCPSELAYGDQGAPPKIPGGSTLVFDVELFSIKDDSKKVSKNDKKPARKAKKN